MSENIAVETPPEIDEDLVIRQKKNFNWYVVKTYGPEGMEDKVKECIEADVIRASQQEFIGRVFIPDEEFYEVKRGKRKSSFSHRR